MGLPAEQDLYQVLEATWPAAKVWREGPWTFRNGDGGGQRVSSATAEALVSADDLARAEDTMRAMGQDPLFFIRNGDDARDTLRDNQGYEIHDPVTLYSVEVSRLTDVPIPPISAFTLWPPLAIQADLWREGGIGPARLRVMDRAAMPKTTILARHNDQPAGVAFVSCLEKVAMIHAIDVSFVQRRLGVGSNILRKAAYWAQDQGVAFLSLAVTRSNSAANALYSSLGMQVIGYYHYRRKQSQ